MNRPGSSRLISWLSVFVLVPGLHAGTPGRLANPGFEGLPVKSVYFFAGNWRNGAQFYEADPSDNTGLYTVHPADSRHLGWSERPEYRGFALQTMIDAGVNTVTMSYWGPRGTDNWAYWSPMQTSTYAHDELFDSAVGKPLFILPCLESSAATPNSTAFSFMDCFPGENTDPAPALIARIEDLIGRYLLHPENPEWPGKWARLYDASGSERVAVCILHAASNQQPMDASTFAEGFDRAAERIFEDTGVRIGFTLDVLPPDTYAPGSYRPSARSDGPALAETASVLAVQCFLSEIWCGTADEGILAAWKREFASEWIRSGVPFFFDATPGYDAHVVFPGSVNYGNNENWRNAQTRIVRDLKPEGLTFNSWNGYTEGMTAVASLQYGEDNARWAARLFALQDSICGATGIDSGTPLAPGRFRLYPNYPNPFNPSTAIPFSVDDPCRMILRVYDDRGTEVRILSDAFYQRGVHEVRFDATGLPSGVYVIRMEAEGFTASRKIALVK